MTPPRATFPFPLHLAEEAEDGCHPCIDMVAGSSQEPNSNSANSPLPLPRQFLRRDASISFNQELILISSAAI